jgi:hypothetical protein
VIEVVVEVPGSAPLLRDATTADDGRAQIPLPDLPDGAVIRAAVTAPGPHQEWDGDGNVQRMATSTSVPVRAVVGLPPLPGHAEVHKRSSDPTIGVAGATFVLTDRDGNEVGTATSSSDGVARFAPIDVARHLPPYRVRESTAPAGLIVTDHTVEVPAVSRDPVRPTVVEITNEPRTAPLALRKLLSIDDAGPVDLSGFSFQARRRSDGAVHSLVTGADGEAAPVDLPWGTYDVCEVGVPDWATGLIDTGCRAVVLDATSQAGHGVVVEYVNEIPPPAVDTSLSGPTDGDRTAVAGDVEIVDRVALTGLIPGVRYTIDGEVVRPDEEHVPVIATGRAELVATASTATIDVVFEIEGLPTGRVVATERITVGGVVVAVHRDLDDPDQTLMVVPPTSTTTSTTTTTTPTTTTSPDSTTTTTTVSAVTTTVPAVDPPVTTSSGSTLPRTGNGDTTAGLLRIGDVGFVLGIALVAIAGLAPRRHGRDEAGC